MPSVMCGYESSFVSESFRGRLCVWVFVCALDRTQITSVTNLRQEK